MTEPGRAESAAALAQCPRLAAGEPFDFVCAGCGDCCRNRRDLVLSGYDLYRIARRLGLPYWRAMQRVVLPQAIRTMVPSIINQFIITLKDTSILSVIGFPELTNMGKTIAGNTFKSLQTWVIVGIMYMIVIVALSKLAKRIERRIDRGR